MAGDEGVFVEIGWSANPMRGDRFEDVWRPAAEAALDYGATYWSFVRAMEGQLDFIQHAIFPSKPDFDRYWYSEEIAEARAQAAGLFQIPVLPALYRVVGSGVARTASTRG